MWRRRPADGLEPLDVRRASDAIPALRARETTLFDVMESSADIDGVAASGLRLRTRVLPRLVMDGSGPVADRTSEDFLELLAAEPDTFVATRQDRDADEAISDLAKVVPDVEPEGLKVEIRGV